MDLSLTTLKKELNVKNLSRSLSSSSRSHPFVASDNPCWVAVQKKPEHKVEGCRYVRLPNFNVLSRWRRVFLYPLLLKVRKNEPEVKKDLHTLAEELKATFARMNNAAGESESRSR